MVKQIVGSFLYYTRDIDNILLLALNTIDAKQTVATKKKKINVIGFLTKLLCNQISFDISQNLHGPHHLFRFWLPIGTTLS